MQMVWHNNIAIYGSLWKFLRERLDDTVHKATDMCQLREGRPLPYNCRENVFSVLGAYCYKICTGCAVIKSEQSCGLSFGEFVFHFITSVSL